MAPPLQAEDDGSPTEKELFLGAIQVFTFPPYDGLGQAGFHHMSGRPAYILDWGQGLGLWSNAPGGFQ
jgi:hypothetical protein